MLQRFKKTEGLKLSKPTATATICWHQDTQNCVAATKRGNSLQQARTFGLLRPELQGQWNRAKNQHLGDRQITASSDLRVWWSCNQCPSGLPYEWPTTVNIRQNMESQCP